MQYEVDSYKLEYIEETEQYFISFKDSVRENHRLEIQKEIFDIYMQSRKEYKKIESQYNRNEEQTEISLYKKDIVSEINVEDIVIQKLANNNLRKTIQNIPSPHNRRLEMYIFMKMPVREIALNENKKERTIRYSISKGINEIAKEI